MFIIINNYMPQFIKDFIRAYRHRKILRTIKVPKNGVILDLSCSDGSFLGRLHTVAPNLNLFGIDISSEDIQKAKTNFPGISFKTGSVDKLDFESNSFDTIFSTMSLHHYEKPNEFFIVANRVLKLGGILYLTDLIPKYEWTQRIHNWKGCPEPYHFERFYSIKDLEKIINPLGFNIIKDSRVTLVPRIRLLAIQKS